MQGIKQEALAFDLGDDWSQRKISILEQKEVIEDVLLEQVAKILKVPVDAIKNFDEEKAVMNIQNNYEGSNSSATSVGFNNNNIECTFNPLDKLMEQVEKNEKLYEALLKEKDEKIALMERLIGKGQRD
jgi:transcriptional regulator with XRE-family HTH domain